MEACLGGFTQPLQLCPARRCTAAQPFSTLQQLQPTGRQQELPFAARWIHTSTAAAGEVVVPAMGDSITEGSVAAVLKQPGAQAAVQAKPTTGTLCWGWSQRCQQSGAVRCNCRTLVQPNRTSEPSMLAGCCRCRRRGA